MLLVLLPWCSSVIGHVVAELPEQTDCQEETVLYVHTCSCVCDVVSRVCFYIVRVCVCVCAWPFQ